MTVSNVQTNMAASFTKTAPAKEKSGKDQGFQSIMDLGSQKVASNMKNDVEQPKETETDTKMNQISDNKPEDNQSKVETSKKQDSSSTDNVADKLESKSESVEDEQPKVVENILTDALADVKNMVMESLSIDEDQLDQMLQDMGLNLMDLLNPQTMAQLVMNQNQLTSPGELLNNPELTDLVKDINSQLENILSEHELTLSDDGKLQMNLQGEMKEIIVEEKPIIDNIVSEPVNLNEEEDGSNEPHVSVSINNGDSKGTTDFSNNHPSFTGQESFSKNKGEIAPEPITVNGNQILQNLNQQVENIFTDKLTAAQQTDVVNQILEAVKVNIKADMTTMELQLNPASLGKVQVQVAAKDGVMTAQISTQTEAAKNAIEAQLVTLKESFQNQGLKVEAVEVSVSPQGFQEQEGSKGESEDSKGNKGKRKINLNLDDLDLSNNLTEEEQIAVDLMKENGNSVDYSA